MTQKIEMLLRLPLVKFIGNYTRNCGKTSINDLNLVFNETFQKTPKNMP